MEGISISDLYELNEAVYGSGPVEVIECGPRAVFDGTKKIIKCHGQEYDATDMIEIRMKAKTDNGKYVETFSNAKLYVEKMFDNKKMHIYLAIQNKKIIGYGIACWMNDYGEIYKEHIWYLVEVAVRFPRRKIGSKIIKAMTTSIPKGNCEYLCSMITKPNSIWAKFLQRKGFSITKAQKGTIKMTFKFNDIFFMIKRYTRG